MRMAPVAAAIGVALVAGIVYLPALSNDWVNWDDPQEILCNTPVHSLSWPSIQEMFTEPVNGNTIPLIWLSHAAVWFFWADNAAAHHMTNIVLHSANCFLAFFFFYTLLGLSRRWRKEVAVPPPVRFVDIGVASAATLLWGIHPLHVESVAWVTERKDLLCTFFFLLSLLAYLRYASSNRAAWWRIWPCFLFFILALLSKPMAVTLPVVFLIFDWWPLNRLAPPLFPPRGPARRVVLEKVPFLVISILCGLVAIHSQDTGVIPLEKVPLDFRIMNGFHSIVFYMEKMFWPVDLAPVYPITDPAAAAYSASYVISLLIVVVITALSFSSWGRKRPSIPASWLFYLVTLAPVLGILQVGRQAAADRYTYIPMLSLCLLVAGKLTALEATIEGKGGFPKALKPVPLLYAIGLVLLGWLCVGQIKVWKDSVTLWEHQVAVFPGEAAVAYANLGGAYRKEGRLDDAIIAYRQALDLLETKNGIFREPGTTARPEKVLVNKEEGQVRSCLGSALLDKGLKHEAAIEFQKAIIIDPNDFVSICHLGSYYQENQRLLEAENAFRKALSLNPECAEAAANLAALCFKQRKIPEALAAVRQAIALSPSNPKLYLLEGEALEVSGNVIDAVRSYEKGLQVKTGLTESLKEVLEAHLARGRRRLGQ